jgi:hypothetical protein
MQIGKILAALRELPEDELKKVVEEASRILAEKKASAEPKLEYNALQQILLNGPVMTDEQYQAFLESRSHFNNSSQTDWPDEHLPNSLFSPEDE